MLAANRGVPAAPLREAASGGELSRVMLALFGVASAGGPQTLVFDEVDAGVGGQTANAVGERLQALGADRQVLCITHLPQVAALAGRHFRIEKHAERRAGAHRGGAPRGRRRGRGAVPDDGRGGGRQGRAQARRAAAGRRLAPAAGAPAGAWTVAAPVNDGNEGNEGAQPRAHARIPGRRAHPPKKSSAG